MMKVDRKVQKGLRGAYNFRTESRTHYMGVGFLIARPKGNPLREPDGSRAQVVVLLLCLP